MVCFRPVLRSVGANRLAPARILEPDWIANVALWFAAMVRQQLQCTLVWFESANRLATANLSSIILMDGAPRVLMSFPEDLAKKAEHSLVRLGVQVRTGVMVKDINREGLTIQSQLGTDRLEARTVIWAGGVTVPPLAGTLATRTNAETDKAGNLAVIGRARAVADVFGFRISGLPAWIVWAFIHLAYIVEFQSRLLVFIQWAIQDLTFSRRARLITHSAPTDFNFNEEIAPYAVTQKGGHDKPESLKAS